MSQGFIPIDHYRTKFYQKEGQSKKFKEMTEEQLLAMSKKVYRKLELMSENQHSHNQSYSKLDRYQRSLIYLTNPNIHFDIKTYDERLAYLIMIADPNLVTFKEFLKTNIISLEEIAKVDDPKERNRLLEERSKSIKDLESRVRDQIGFFDAKLLKHEEHFFKRFYNKTELITEVNQNNEDKFLLMSALIQSFDSITPERYQELVSTAQYWLSKVSTKPNTKTAVYSINNQKELLGLNTLAEQYAFFILVVDPNLDMLRIYEEESMIPNVEERIIEEFGYFNKAMLSLEKKYHERFCPNKKLSIWSETK
jgi:hypothetical protein